MSQPNSLRILFALPGLHKVQRGAEAAFESLAIELSKLGHQVTLIGSGKAIENRPYRFIHAGCIARNWFINFPRLPYLRTHYAYEELTFAPGLWSKFKLNDFDVTATCGFPYTNRVLTRRNCPAHVFVTQNGDHMLQATQFDYRRFACDGLVCTNPQIFERNRANWASVLIPNGVDVGAFHPGKGIRSEFGLPENRPIALMVSALTPSKRIIESIAMAARLPDLALVIAGDGELRAQTLAAGNSLMPGRFFLLRLPRERMPDLYRCADLVLHASLDEPFGNVYLEAMATNLPIVAHDSEATRWIMEQSALLVHMKNERRVIAAILDALNRKLTGGREIAQRRFAWPQIARQYAEFFGKIGKECNAETQRHRAGRRE
jgi:glycosyltransferase involved in cell wall biosynthesis